MSLRILHKVGGLLLLLTVLHSAWASYTTEDAIRIRTQTPVVDGSMPPDIVAIQERGVLRQALNQTPVPPFSIQDSKGNWSGLEIDFGRRVAKNLGVKLQIVPAKSYEDIVTLLVEGKADMAMGLSILPKREVYVSFTIPYYSYHPHILVNRLAAAQQGWTTPDKLTEGLTTTNETIKVGVFLDNSMGQILEQKYPNTKAVVYSNRTQCFQDTSAGKIFACMGATPIEIKDFLQKNPQAALHVVDVELVGMQDLLGVAMPWQDFHLREWLNIYINYLEQNGIKKQIAQQYGYSSS